MHAVQILSTKKSLYNLFSDTDLILTRIETRVRRFGFTFTQTFSINDSLDALEMAGLPATNVSIRQSGMHVTAIPFHVLFNT